MIEQQFKNHMSSVGMITKEDIIAGGVLHRIHLNGDKPNSKNGWYVLYGDGVPAGSFGDWKTGKHYNWCAKDEHELTPQEREDLSKRVEEAKHQRAIEDRRIKSETKKKAHDLWGNSFAASPNHPYLQAKSVQPHNTRQSGDRLVIPMQDIEGEIHSLQFIFPDGKKRFLKGGRKKGCFTLIGIPTSTLAICEGYATGASIYESTGLPVAIAFDAGNLLSVSKSLRTRYPDIDIVICADNDTETDGNPGVTKAKEAALAIGARLAIPPVSGDFNDYYRGLKK